MPQTKNAMFRYKVLDRLLKDKYHNYSLNDLTEEVCDAMTQLDAWRFLRSTTQRHKRSVQTEDS